MTENDSVFMRKIRSFVRRSGRMTDSQQNAYDNYWPTYGRLIADGAVDIDQWFGRSGETVLEIGFGMGDSLVQMAQDNPERNYIGIEVHVPGVGRILNTANKAGVTNIRLYQEDAVEVLEKCIADNTLDRVQLFFPDPWHKARHHKRRIVQPEFVQALRKKLKIGGVFHMATDWQNYAEHMLDVMRVQDGYANVVDTEDGYAPRPDYRPLTKFEKRGHRLGHGVWDLLFKKEY